jgi:competence protein ComEA
MKLTTDETRALAFVAFLLVLSGAARLYDTEEPVRIQGETVDIAALAAASRAKLDEQRGARGGTRAGGRRKTEKASSPAKGPVNPNTATVAEMDRLPGVGKATAERIVAGRKGGTYRSVDDLAKVEGIGRARARRLAPVLGLDTVSGAPATVVAHVSQQAGSLSGTGRARNGTSAVAGDGAFGEPLDPNEAAAEELEKLPGIGPSIARRIVAHRRENGRFRTAEDLQSVKGIGPATLSRLRPYIRFKP